MSWDLRPSRVECKCGRAEHCSVAATLCDQRQALVHTALWSRGWLRLAGTWTCHACTARVATIAGEQVMSSAMLERSAALRIVRVGGA